MRNNKGYVRGFDVRTAKRLWISYHPKKGRVWLRHVGKGFAGYTGNTGVWTQITVTNNRWFNLPVESPTSDFSAAPAGQ